MRRFEKPLISTLFLSDLSDQCNATTGTAHEVWVGTGSIVYENSGPGGFVRRNTLANVLARRKVIHIVARTVAAELEAKSPSPNPGWAPRGPVLTPARISQVKLPQEDPKAFSATP